METIGILRLRIEQQRGRCAAGNALYGAVIDGYTDHPRGHGPHGNRVVSVVSDSALREGDTADFGGTDRAGVVINGQVCPATTAATESDDVQLGTQVCIRCITDIQVAATRLTDVRLDVLPSLKLHNRVCIEDLSRRAVWRHLAISFEVSRTILPEAHLPVASGVCRERRPDPEVVRTAKTGRDGQP